MLCLIYTQDARGRAASKSECVYIRQSTSTCVIKSECVYIKQSTSTCVIKSECVYIRQSTSTCVITNMLHFRDSKNLPKPEVACSASLYSNRRWLWLWGRHFNVFITFHVSMTYPIVLNSIMGLYNHQHGICFKVFIADSGEEFRQLVSNCVFYIRK